MNTGVSSFVLSCLKKLFTSYSQYFKANGLISATTLIPDRIPLMFSFFYSFLTGIPLHGTQMNKLLKFHYHSIIQPVFAKAEHASFSCFVILSSGTQLGAGICKKE